MHLKTSFACPSILKSFFLPEEIKITRAEWKNNLLCLSHLTFYNEYTMTWESLFDMIEAVSSLFLQKPYNVEHNLLVAGIWMGAIYENIKQGNTEKIVCYPTDILLWKSY